MINNKKTFLIAGLVILAAGLLLTGCESDAVSPQDETPALTQENAAYQAAMVSLAIAEVGPQIVNFTPAKTVVNYDFVGYEYVSGQVSIDYLLGGPSGADSTPSEADYAHLWTLGEDGLAVTYEGVEGGAIFLSADLMADIDQTAGTATILEGSTGDLVAGVYTGTYAISDLVVGGAGHPSGGTVTFIGGGHTLVATFDGSNMVPISADGAALWLLNLDNGELDPYMPPTF